MYVYTYMHVYIYTYIYRERDGGRQRGEGRGGVNSPATLPLLEARILLDEALVACAEGAPLFGVT